MASTTQLRVLDTLDDAVAMLQFLAEVVPELAHDGHMGGLSETGANGLALFVDHVNLTVQKARELLA